MGGIGNVVVNTIVRMFTKKAVGKAMKSAKSLGGAKAQTSPRKRYTYLYHQWRQLERQALVS
ncbi:MAG: hypothetical protein AVDCRST_MAG25-731 [uncultured Rubrobacteraceae bacterium]|uniref:Uncharacterized protein n=1 Tax=uncultured Rubrobacteraceae bacterium TaxID=349277 RepID=A0A6J4QZZ8_9ACTN|nr:MAG: hypothetical protein AVDCRST_MAG25-731 [uncultured Rubrobacteraceae bacterium]